MLCNQCNKEVPEGAKFCPFCGTALPLPELESVAIESTVLDESR
ncbi:MAG: zinc ribbon domain-containing protein, partial [Clostridia bacterium]|nr:zinc ribbon domain-containing protein [Clostridia bacterium]